MNRKRFLRISIAGVILGSVNLLAGLTFPAGMINPASGNQGRALYELASRGKSFGNYDIIAFNTISQDFIEDDWVTRKSQVQTISEDGLLTSIVNNEWARNTWMNDKIQNVEYDSQGRLSSVLAIDYNSDSSMVVSAFMSYTKQHFDFRYDTEGRVERIINRKIEGGKDIPQIHETMSYRYDNEGRISRRNLVRYSVAGFEQYLDVYIYEAGKLTIVRKQNKTMTWEDKERFTALYDASGKALSSMREEKSAGVWVAVERESFAYQQGVTGYTEHTYEKYVVDTWQPIGRRLHTRNNVGWTVEMVEQVWENGAFTNFARQEIFFTQSVFSDETVFYNYHKTDWVPVRRSLNLAILKGENPQTICTLP